MNSLATAVAARRAVLPFYSPYHFIYRKSLPSPTAGEQEEQRLLHFGAAVDERRWDDSATATSFLYQILRWDSQIAGVPTVKVRAILFATPALSLESVRRFVRELEAQGIRYAVMEVPVEDIRVLQGLNEAAWQLLETRLHYVHDALNTLAEARYPVRAATRAEQSTIGEVSRNNANPYDRFHADPFFTKQQADTFLAEYAAAAVAGYCNEVLVPNDPDVVLDSFLALSYFASSSTSGLDVARAVLAAVGPANKGWHRKLLSEALYRAKDNHASVMLMTTQATNRAAVHNAEQLGFRLGTVTHTIRWATSGG
ncbi:hypothetical protein [Hymenobacter mucosus]|uniref:dTDP-4-amino-4,6-dideoxy-D-galactose acyltransferase n=1 Tax=Hymenobacter mucosus TaxID=1411120 RepID=A0A238YFQ0_9BACT|nr:hypothetical protein [Hymenobacter mucosus]SNR69802.1 dTDP-4-amino-4,6-dideoxy-D-galactose acyltransferase [Hymenobacter mucosus]